jgi:hypothetical protein
MITQNNAKYLDRLDVNHDYQIMRQTHIQVLHEVSLPVEPLSDGWTLNLQWCRYIKPDGTMPMGWRYIYKDHRGCLKPYRGQSRIYGLGVMRSLIGMAVAKGWGDLEGEADSAEGVKPNGQRL